MNSLDILKKQITPSTIGIIYISEDSLEKYNEKLISLDYFFDGQINQSIDQIQANSPHNIFIGKNFGRAIYLLFIKSGDRSSIEKSCKELVSICQTKHESNHFLILNHKYEKEINALLARNFAQYDFTIEKSPTS